MKSDNRSEQQRQFMLEAVIGEVVTYIAEDDGIGLVDAFECFYATQLYSKMLDFETLLYREGPGYLYELYREEVA
jgi:hypothetical protein